MKVKVYLSIGYANANREEILDIDESGLEGLSEEERDKAIQEDVDQWMWDRVDLNWEIID